MATAGSDDVATMALRVWTYRQGLMVSTMLHLGDRLGLFAAMAGRGPMSAEQVAAESGLDPRWCLEWLRCLAAADVVDSADGLTFELGPAAADVVVQGSDSLFCAAGALAPPPGPDVLDAIAESFLSGRGVAYDTHGAEGAHQVDATLAPWARHGIVEQLLPRVEGLVERLEEGVRVVDLGCGAATLLCVLAAEFPRSTFEGVDPSTHALSLARERVVAADLTNVDLHDGDDSALDGLGPFDVALTFDCLHDMAFPDRAASAVGRTLVDEGIWLVKEIRTSGDFATDRKNPVLAMLYATSVLTCMASALSEEGGAGLGTLGLPPAAVAELVGAAGFDTVATHDIGDPANLYYEVRR